ncbi:hypothetical protein ACLOJK_012689 [Asimina triloba]
MQGCNLGRPKDPDLTRSDLKSSRVRIEFFIFSVALAFARTPALSAAPSSSAICCCHRRSAAVVLTPPIFLPSSSWPISCRILAGAVVPSSSSPILAVRFSLSDSRRPILAVSSPFSHLPCLSLISPASSPLIRLPCCPPAAPLLPPSVSSSSVSQLRIPPAYGRSLSPSPSPLPASVLPASPFLLHLNLRRPLHGLRPLHPLPAALPPLLLPATNGPATIVSLLHVSQALRFVTHPLHLPTHPPGHPHKLAYSYIFRIMRQHFLRFFLRAAPSSSSPFANSRFLTQPISSKLQNPHPPHSLRFYSKSKSKSSSSKVKAAKAKAKSGKDSSDKAPADPFAAGGVSASTWTQEELAVSDDEDISGVRDPSAYQADRSLDVGPDGRPLFTSAKSLSELGRKDVPVYMDFRLKELSGVLGEGLVAGMKKEFKMTERSAMLVRQSFLDLRDNFRRVVDPPLYANNKGQKVRKQIVLDGPISCGKSITLAMLVHWARSEGWLVFYVPNGKEWTHGGLFYKQPQTGLWDTPVQGANILQDELIGAEDCICCLQDFLKCNESLLRQLPCRIFDPIPLGEGAGAGWMKGVDSMAMPEGSTLFDLIQTGLKYTHAAVGVVVRLRVELSLVKDVPVLIAVDQYNSWFTFSSYEEAVTPRSCRPIHAKELSTCCDDLESRDLVPRVSDLKLYKKERLVINVTKDQLVLKSGLEPNAGTEEKIGEEDAAHVAGHCYFLHFPPWIKICGLDWTVAHSARRKMSLMACLKKLHQVLLYTTTSISSIGLKMSQLSG